MLGIDADDDGVASDHQLVSDLEGERRETALMPTHFLAIDVHQRRVICGPDVEKLPPIRQLGEIEDATKPDQPVVPGKRGVLTVPVAGNGHSGRRVEVILEKVYRALWPGDVLKHRVAARVCANHAGFQWIDDVMPLARQVDDLPGLDIDRRRRVRPRGNRLGCGTSSGAHDKDGQEAAQL